MEKLQKCECCNRLINVSVLEHTIRKGYKVYPPKQERVDIDPIFGYTIFSRKGFYALVLTGNKKDESIVCDWCWKEYYVGD